MTARERLIFYWTKETEARMNGLRTGGHRCTHELPHGQNQGGNHRSEYQPKIFFPHSVHLLMNSMRKFS